MAAPNVVLIYADDMGWGDVGYHGFDDVLTPNIDRIAESGVQFTQGYVSASVCGPSRAGLLTGVYQQRFGCGENANMAGYPDKMKYPLAGLPASQPIIAEMLKERGYRTSHIGKWHMGIDKTLRPLARGFDEYFGFVNGAHDFERWEGHFGDNRGRWPLWRGDDPLPAQDNAYLTDLFSDEAVGFIERGARNAERGMPFFLYLAYNAIHAPWQVPETYLERTKHLSDNHERNFIAAMILAMDDGVGRVQAALEKHGLAENTIVIFMSDNGSPRAQGLTWKNRDGVDDWQEGPMSCKAGLRGFKGDTYEGGTRVPFCMSWPGKIKPGIKHNFPVSNLDIVPTILAAAADHSAFRIPHSAFDGVDLLPFINGTKGDTRPHQTLYWRRDNDYAIRHGDWKLQWNDQGSTRNITLFNLADDPQERNDLAAAMPEKAQALQDLFDAWDSTMPDNEWWGGPINRRRDFAQGGRTVVAQQPYLHAHGKVR
ncbi:MAG: sulfatase-like hydrolase/transferase [Kiritimatiellae bacterium]|nr:sulfatase-like hydrolase/transferase [Kiritimatiellia bacterium]